jgi:hypothetical protein
VRAYTSGPPPACFPVCWCVSVRVCCARAAFNHRLNPARGYPAADLPAHLCLYPGFEASGPLWLLVENGDAVVAVVRDRGSHGSLSDASHSRPPFVARANRVSIDNGLPLWDG